MKPVCAAALALLASDVACAQQSIGVNFPGLGYFNNSAFYADVFMATSGNNGRWDTADGNSAAPLDATGAPTVAGATTNFSANFAGDMVLTWQGSGQVLPDGSCTAGPVTVTNSVNTQTVNCPVTNSTTPGFSYRAVNGYTFYAYPPVTNIHMMLPAASICGGMWNCDFINQTRSFAGFRYMDAMSTNSDFSQTTINPVTNWSDRTWPSDGSRGGSQQGIAYEDVINLSNFTGQAAWINVPPLATDDYVCRLARLLAYGEAGDKTNTTCNPTAPGNRGGTPIAANVSVYIESGNEPWNWGFFYTNQLYCWANGVSQDPSTPCPAGTTPPSFYVQQQLSTAPWGSSGPLAGDGYGRQAVMQMLVTYRNKQIFRQVFTAAGIANQPRHVLNTQSFNGGYNVYYIQNFFVPTYKENPADVMAFAPYLGPSCPNADGGCVQDKTVAADYTDISNTYNNASYGMPAEMTDDVNQAKSVGMAIASYEGGVAWQQDNVTLLINATRNAQMKTWTLKYLREWSSLTGNALFMDYNLYSPWGQSGNWGAKANQADACSQRWSAIMELTGGTDCVP